MYYKFSVLVNSAEIRLQDVVPGYNQGVRVVSAAALKAVTPHPSSTVRLPSRAYVMAGRRLIIIRMWQIGSQN